MLQILKKNPNASAAAVAPAWHPNFRNYAELPDTKTVRTSFFLNGVAVFIAVVLLLTVGYQEYLRSVLSQQINNHKTQIEHDKAANEKAIALYKKFQEQEKRIMDLDVFMKRNKIITSEFIMRIGDTLPKNIAISQIEYRETGVNMRGRVSGSSEQATGLASSYEKQLRADEKFSKDFKTINMQSLAPDPAEKSSWIFFMEMKFTAKGGK